MSSSLPDPRSNITALHPNRQSVAAYLDDWLQRKVSLRPSTAVAYKIHIERFWKPALGDRKLSRLSVTDIEQAHNRISRGDFGTVSASTLRRIHATLMSALNTAVRRGELISNPAALVELPRPPRPEMRVWTADQAATFLHRTSGHPWHLLYRMLLITGMRRGEALGAQWRDLSTDRRSLQIRRQLTSVCGTPQLGPPKSTKGLRTVHLDPDTAKLLCRLHERVQDPSQTGHLFQAPEGAALNPPLVSRVFTVLVTNAGLPPIRLHDLRHTSASLALEAGEPLTQVSRRLGHATVAITGDIYTHISTAAAQAAVDQLAAQLT